MTPNTTLTGYYMDINQEALDPDATLTSEEFDAGQAWIIREVNRLLPDYAEWNPDTSEIIVPADRTDEEIDWERVTDQAYENFLDRNIGIVEIVDIDLNGNGLDEQEYDGGYGSLSRQAYFPNVIVRLAHGETAWEIMVQPAIDMDGEVITIATPDSRDGLVMKKLDDGRYSGEDDVREAEDGFVAAFYAQDDGHYRLKDKWQDKITEMIDAKYPAYINVNK